MNTNDKIPAGADENESAQLAHDQWIRAQIDQALQEADATVWLSNEEVKARSAARRAVWEARAKQQTLEAAA